MTVEELFVLLGFKIDSASKSKAQGEANELKSMLTKALGIIGIGFSINGIKNFAQETASLAAEVRAVNTQFKQTFGDMVDVAEASLKDVSEKTGIAESRMKEAYSRMASFAKTGGMETAEANDFTARAMVAIADNAAYMDKSIEYTQETFQKLLKGNFQLDDNLNFNLAEAERNEMAMAMFQKKTYNDLTENEKKELILQKLINANKQMGAEGQAATEAGEYTNQVGELSDVVKQLKAQVGMIFLPHVLSVSTNLAKLLTKVADALGDAEKEGTLAYKMSQKLTKAMDKFWDICKKVYSTGKRVIEIVGGVENAAKLLAAAIGAIMAAQIPGYLSKVVDFLLKINLTTAAITFGILALFLVIDDFIGFMQGKESAIGHLIEKLGGDPDEVRNGITGFFDKIQEMADGAFESLKEKAENLTKAISDTTQKLAEFFGYEDSGQMLQDIFTGIAEAAQTIAGSLQTAAGALAFITGLDDALTEGENVATSKGTERMSDEDAKKYKRLKHDLKGKSGSERTAIENDIAALEEKYEGTDTTTWGQKQYAQGRANVHNSTDRVFNGGRSPVDGSWSTAVQDTKNSIADFIYDITAGIVDLRASAQDQNDAVTKDSADSKSAVGNAAESSSSDVKNAANKTIEMMNNMQGVVSGLQGVIAGSQNQLQALAGQFPSSTVNDIASRQSSNKNVNVNMTYNSTFNGDTRSNQKAASAQLNSSAKDASTYTANAVAFG